MGQRLLYLLPVREPESQDLGRELRRECSGEDNEALQSWGQLQSMLASQSGHAQSQHLREGRAWSPAPGEQRWLP